MASVLAALAVFAPAGAGADPSLAPPFDDSYEVGWCSDHVAASCALSHAVTSDGAMEMELSSTPWQPLGVGGGGATAMGSLVTSDAVLEETDLVEYRVRVLIEEAEATLTGLTAEHGRVHPGSFASVTLGFGLAYDGCQCVIEGSRVYVVHAHSNGPHWDLLLPDRGPAMRRNEILELGVRMVPEDEGYLVPPGRVTLTVSLVSTETIAGYHLGVNGFNVPALDAGRAHVSVRARVLDVVRTA